MEDIRDAYVKHKGNMDHIMSTVIGADEGCEDKIREVIQYYVDLGEVEMYPKFFKEPLEKREKRKQRAKREAKAAAKALKDLEVLKHVFNDLSDRHNVFVLLVKKVFS